VFDKRGLHLHRCRYFAQRAHTFPEKSHLDLNKKGMIVSDHRELEAAAACIQYNLSVDHPELVGRMDLAPGCSASMKGACLVEGRFASAGRMYLAAGRSASVKEPFLIAGCFGVVTGTCPFAGLPAFVRGCLRTGCSA